nr:hypothetical protein BaRGS_031856 [Batillaria attramentaria]
MEVAFPREAWPGLQEKYVTLLNASCSATGNATHVTVLIPHDGCGTSTQAILDGYVFENQVITRDVAVNGLISRVRDVHMTVHCHYHGQAMLENFYIVNTGLIRFSDVASGHYKLSSLEVFARNCRATPTQDNTLSQYLFLDEGCAKDPSLQQNKETSDLETLQLQAFQFLADNSSSLVLHCDVLVYPGNTKYGATGRAADWNVCRLPLLALFCLMATTVSTQLLART